MRLVEHHEIPTRCGQESFYSGRPLQGVDTGDEPVVLGEGIGLAVGDVTLGPEHLKIEIEDIVQFTMPIVH